MTPYLELVLDGTYHLFIFPKCGDFLPTSPWSLGAGCHSTILHFTKITKAQNDILSMFFLLELGAWPQ